MSRTRRHIVPRLPLLIAALLLASAACAPAADPDASPEEQGAVVAERVGQ